LAAPLRAVIGRLDTAHVVSVRDVKSLDDVVGEATNRQRFRAVLAGGFATLAAALAAIGLFGLVAYSTQQQLRDFGVRRALGATTSDIVKLVAGGALRIALGGAAAGLFLAAALTRAIDGLLFGVQPLDPATLGFVLVALTSIVVLATAGPARRAARVDPAITLRGE
jgi:ABC-type antimicrobial peptide transport system permease subunit